MTAMKTPTRRSPARGRVPACLTGHTTLAVTMLVLALALLLPGGTQAQETGRCARVATPWPIVLPDGSTHESDALQLCLKLKLNPVTGIHELRVDGISRGMVRSRIGKSEGRSMLDPIVVFRRVDSGAHLLVGYAWPDGDVMRTFNLYDLSRSRSAGARTRELALDRTLASEEFVLLVARLPN
jgi:hypothetical protein